MSDALLSPAENHLSREMCQTINEAIQGTLAMLVDSAMVPSGLEVKEFASLDALTAELPANGVMGIFTFGGALQGPAAFIFDTKQAIAIADVLVGGGATGGDAISDIQMGAVGEAVSQMVGVMSSAFSQFMKNPVEIAAPQIAVLSPEKLAEAMADIAAGAVGVKYVVTGGQQIPEVTIWQVQSLATMKNIVKAYGGAMPDDPTLKHSDDTVSEKGAPEPVAVGVAAGPAVQAQAGGAGPAMGGRMSEPGGAFVEGGGTVTVQPVSYPSFDNYSTVNGPANKNLELVMDVCLNLTVELGRTEIPIKEILELTRGSVVELDKVAGEPVDLYANGKMIAKGEVVVIEDNFGLRITSIVAPAERIRGL